MRNFQASFAVPFQDTILVSLLKEREEAPYTGSKEDMERIERITDRIIRIGGIFLNWV